MALEKYLVREVLKLLDESRITGIVHFYSQVAENN